MHTVTSLDNSTLQGLEKICAPSMAQHRTATRTVHTFPGRSLAERQLNTPRALSSRWVSARAKVSGSDYCEEVMNELVGRDQMNTQGQEAQCIELFWQMPC